MLNLALSVFFITVLTVLAVIGAALFWQRLFAGRSGQNATYFFTAEDGWKLAVHRYRPDRCEHPIPVILCHGLSSNRFAFDLPACPSLARYLRMHGFDVWLVELRGSGMSEKPGLVFSDVPYSWGFHDHLTKDVPAVIRFVMEQTGASKINWIGHSMGGMLIRAHVSAHPDAPVQTAITIGSPLDFSKMKSTRFGALARFGFLVRPCPIFPLPFIGKAVSPLAHMLPGFLMNAFHSPNIDQKGAQRIVATASELVTSTRLWLDFGRFIRTGVFGPGDGSRYVTDGSPANMPVLVLAGSRDGMAPLESVKAGYEMLPEPGAGEFYILGKEIGFAEDYGHLDLLSGSRAHKEVFPIVLTWLSKHGSEDS
jgi:pimeloyl-ACP methyl ester carboxylesterase